MARVKGGVNSHRRHKKVLDRAKGYYGNRSKNWRTANQAVLKAGQYAYRDRRVRKREFRALWIVRINAAARAHGLRYSEFMHQLQLSGVLLNRKMLAHLAYTDPAAFESLITKVSGAERKESEVKTV